MKSLNTKLALSAFGIIAMLTSPAFAQKRHPNQSAVYSTIPGDESGAIPGYDESGGVVALPNDHSRAMRRGGSPRISPSCGAIAPQKPELPKSEPTLPNAPEGFKCAKS